MGFVYFLAAVLFLVFNFMIAAEFANIADAKGYAGTKYGIYTFFFGIVGMLMVVALPQVKNQTKKGESSTPSASKVTTQKAVPSAKSKNTPQPPENEVDFNDATNYENFIDTTCVQCGKAISVLANQETITCPWCDTELNIKH